MAPPPHHKEYHDLMEGNGDGHYLYQPQSFRDFHPGSIGYFDSNGNWYLITDILKKEDGFEPVDVSPLALAEPFESVWKTVSSGSEAETSFGLDSGLSGALSGAPVDVSANARNKSGSTGQAALITTGVVKQEKFRQIAHPVFMNWVKKNIKKLTSGDIGYYVRTFGLYAIYTTWSTQECAIKLQSGHSRDTGGGVAVGATSIGKIGASGSSLKHLKSEGWRTYEAKENDQGLVVVYSGMRFNLHTFPRFHKSLKVTQYEAAVSDLASKIVTDENGEPVRDGDGKLISEKYRLIRDENGKVIGEERVDEEAEAREREEKQREERERQRKEEEPEECFNISFEPEGMSASNFAENQQSGELTFSEPEITNITMTPEDKAWLGEVSRKMAELEKIPDEGQRKAERQKLLAELKDMRERLELQPRK